MPTPRLVTTGLRELITAADEVGGETKVMVREGLRKAGEPVRRRARDLFTPLSQETPNHFAVTVRRAGRVDVEQRLRKVTGEHPEWGALQMREALIPAADQKLNEVQMVLFGQMDKLARKLEGS